MNRSKKLNKNIIYSLGLSGISMVISFALYPLLINLLGKAVYGTWLTIASISTWMTFFEFGLGSGLKNNLGKALSHKDYKLGKELVSTAYAVIGIIIVTIGIVFLSVSRLIDWNLLLQSAIPSQQLCSFVSIMVAGFILIFALKLLGNIASAHQDPYIEKLINTSISFGALLTVLILLYFHETNIVWVAFWWTISTVTIWIFYSIVLFRTRYKPVRPNKSFIGKKHLKSLISLGLQFFIIQICLVIINGSTNFIISHYLGSEEVVTYNATYKLFSIANILYTIIIAPTWPAFIDAIEKKDKVWTQRTINRMLRIWAMISCGMLLILFTSPIIFKIWLKGEITVPWTLSILLYLYFTGVTFGGIFNMYVNASGALRTQMLFWLGITILYIPTVIYLIKYANLGVISVAIGLLLSNVYYVIIAPIQYKKLIRL